MENWFTIQDYPDYSISDLGRVRNDKTDRVLTVAVSTRGHPYIGLMMDGVQVKRSVARLVSEAFLWKPRPYFDAPIHLDGDLLNCCASNLAWRPRWFAMKFTRQFKMELPDHAPIRNCKTGEIFDDAWIVVKRDGLLYMDIVLAASNFNYVFPTMEYFEWAD